jgi:hypothetical protein
VYRPQTDLQLGLPENGGNFRRNDHSPYFLILKNPVMKKIAKHLFSVCIFVIVLIPESTVIAQNSIILNEINDAFQTYSQSFHEERLYLHVDKPFLQPGETLWFAGYLQSGSELKPSEISRVVHVRLNDGKGETVKELKLLNHNGKLTGDITLDEKVAPGVYSLEAYTRWQMNGKIPIYLERYPK